MCSQCPVRAGLTKDERMHELGRRQHLLVRVLQALGLKAGRGDVRPTGRRRNPRLE
jgi:hypothetical protein